MTKDEGALFRMTEWSYFTSVISSEVRKLKLGTGGCATTLDSSLRCAPFRMTGDEGAAFRMTEYSHFSSLKLCVCRMPARPSTFAAMSCGVCGGAAWYWVFIMDAMSGR